MTFEPFGTVGTWELEPSSLFSLINVCITDFLFETIGYTEMKYMTSVSTSMSTEQI